MRDAGIDFDVLKDYDWIKSKDFTFTRRRIINHIGYAGYYLEQINGDEADASVYRKLVDIDTGLGTKASDQLYVCLRLTSRPELIKVRIYFLLNNSPSQI